MAQVLAMRQAQRLGLLGLLPFFSLAALAWLPDGAAVGRWHAAGLARLGLVAYAAVILSFLGAVHWGLALSAPDLPAPLRRLSLTWGVIPSLLGWLALLMTFVGVAPWLVFAVLIADLLLVRVIDGALLRRHPAPPGGYLELRSRLTAGASLALTLALAASF
jgi:hypothetical protein